MGNDNKKVDADVLKERTKAFAIDIIKLCRKLPRHGEGRVIGYQLLKSGTSAGANYRAACRGRSRKEFYAKLCIVVEEMDETEFWLELIHDTGLITTGDVNLVMKECRELLYILSKSRSTMGKSLKK